MTDDHYTGALLEDINHKLTAIMEGQAPMAGVPAQLERIDSRLARVEDDVKTIKAAIKDQSTDQRSHAKRLAKLERLAV